jgi:hypothetical protein
VAIPTAQIELVVVGRAACLHLTDRPYAGVALGAVEVGLDLAHGAERIVLPGEDQRPIRIDAPPGFAEAGQDELELRRATPLEVEVVLDRPASGGFDRGGGKRRTAAVVSHQHLRRGPLGQGANQPQHLRRVAV